VAPGRSDCSDRCRRWQRRQISHSTVTALASCRRHSNGLTTVEGAPSCRPPEPHGGRHVPCGWCVMITLPPLGVGVGRSSRLAVVDGRTARLVPDAPAHLVATFAAGLAAADPRECEAAGSASSTVAGRGEHRDWPSSPAAPSHLRARRPQDHRCPDGAGRVHDREVPRVLPPIRDVVPPQVAFEVR